MRESVIEKALMEEVKKRGGITYKFTSPGNAGVPDRLVLLPGGRVLFIECKAPGAKPGGLQIWQINRIRALGHRAEVLDSKEAIAHLLETP